MLASVSVPRLRSKLAAEPQPTPCRPRRRRVPRPSDLTLSKLSSRTRERDGRGACQRCRTCLRSIRHVRAAWVPPVTQESPARPQQLPRARDGAPPGDFSADLRNRRAAARCKPPTVPDVATALVAYSPPSPFAVWQIQESRAGSTPSGRAARRGERQE